jgi:glycosyltransferase involved in cell wall biosynthesis
MLDIIIPAYNCKNTLPRALASILANTNSEKCIVTIVDDCSTESLEPIVNDFKKYLKIQYIKLDKNLRWPGLVRQVGIDKTTSPYIMFLDADDIFAPEAIDKAYSTIINTDNDVIIGAFAQQLETNEMIPMDTDKTTWVHGNIYKRQFLIDNEIYFFKGYNEDGAFNTQCYLLSDKVGTISNCLYYWLWNDSSITRKKDGEFSTILLEQFITTLIPAYENILNKTKNLNKVLQNMGTHFAFCFKMMNECINENKQKEIELGEKAIENFSKKFIQSLSLEQQYHFKKGFKEGIKNYLTGEKISLNIQDFLNQYNTHIVFTLEDLLQEEENESSTN